MNYSHDNWSAILAHIGKPEELDTSARNAGALTRRREIRDAATLLRLGLAYGPGGCHYVKSLHGLSSMTLQHYLTWFPEAAAECRRLVWHTCRTNTCCTRRSYGLYKRKEIASCRWNSNQCARGGSAEWRLHMGYDPHTCQFTDFELTDSRDAERLDRFAQTADEIRIADRGFGSRPECIRSLAFGEADYIVRVHWRGLRWLTAEGMRFDMMGFLRGLDCGKNGETTVMIGNSGNKKPELPFRHVSLPYHFLPKKH